MQSLLRSFGKIWKIQIGESTLWHLQSVKSFSLLDIWEGQLSRVYKGLRALVWDIKLEWFRLVPLYSIFFNSKEGDWITFRGRRHIAEPCKLFVYMWDWCMFSCVFFPNLSFRIKGWSKIGCQFIINFSTTWSPFRLFYPLLFHFYSLIIFWQQCLHLIVSWLVYHFLFQDMCFCIQVWGYDIPHICSFRYSYTLDLVL